MLSDSAIKKALMSNRLEISPFTEENLNPNSYDVTLSKHGFARVALPGASNSFQHQDIIPDIDPFDSSTYATEKFSALKYRLLPGEFLLASINERINLLPESNIACEITGKSSLARLGLLVHATAGLGDVGWAGHYVLELKNLNPDRSIILHADMKIAQLIFTRVEGCVQRPYGHANLNSKYQNQSPGQGSLYWKNRRENEKSN